MKEFSFISDTNPPKIKRKFDLNGNVFQLFLNTDTVSANYKETPYIIDNNTDKREYILEKYLYIKKNGIIYYNLKNEQFSKNNSSVSTQ